MAKKTLLEIVQDILSDMTDDEVNSISDTVESMQVAVIVKSTYEAMISNKNWPHLRKVIQLDATTDSELPNYLTLPEGIKECLRVEYNKRTESDLTRDRWEEVKWVEPDEFLIMTAAYNTKNTNVQRITDYGGADILIKNDQHPSFYTSFDDTNLVFNSYNINVEDTLQNSKNRAIVYKEPEELLLIDTAIPNLPSEAFPALIAEAKSTCFLRIKQSTDAKAEQESQRQRAWLSRKAFKVGGGIKLPNRGRRRKK